MCVARAATAASTASGVDRPQVLISGSGMARPLTEGGRMGKTGFRSGLAVEGNRGDFPPFDIVFHAEECRAAIADHDRALAHLRLERSKVAVDLAPSAGHVGSVFPVVG